ncbi:unnamed protein product [Chilo suppressalis]|uniref:Pericentrin/AKAP-450 centrosomal targeting domain-containing protein n=1 Tax=Chilo suppressalis TaxID=168631 RepID=A0ABN8L6H4_CHISP|nr:unnamed protein product [Chilo suppressalis]
MDDPQNDLSQTNEVKNVLPDVVHSQQIPTVAVVNTETELAEHDAGAGAESSSIYNAETTSETESISEHLPFKVEESLSETDNIDDPNKSEPLLKAETEQEKVTVQNSSNIPVIQTPNSDSPSLQDPNKQSTSWPLDGNAVSDIHHLSEESPVNLAISSDYSREVCSNENVSLPLPDTPKSEGRGSCASPLSDKYVDSLNDSIHKSLESDYDKSLGQVSDSNKEDFPDGGSSGSEEIIKLDIRGQGAPKFSLPTAKIIFGPPPQGSTILDPNIDPIPVFPNLLSPFLVGAGDTVKVEEIFDFTKEQFKEPSSEKSLELSLDKSIEISLEKNLSTDKTEQQDLLVEEMIVEEIIERGDEKHDEPSLTNQPKSFAPEETMSLSTMTTDYKTICEEFHAKRTARERDNLKAENEHLSSEVLQLQHTVGERSSSEHDTVKAQLSDFVKYQSMVKDDSTKFYSALMSGGSSLQSSNGEKDMDHEEITVNYSKSDLKSSSSSDEFQTGFENKLSIIISKFEDCIEENLRNKLRESIIQVLCDEISKMRIDSDTEIKDLETQMRQEKQTYTMETRKLRELLASVKAGTADIDALREELCIKHEKEMENLRTYFEKKCTDMERSYSEEVWRGRCRSSYGSEWSLEDGAGDHASRHTRRARSAELPSLTAALDVGGSDQGGKASCRKHELMLDELRAEHAATLATLQDQITQLKAHIQTSENTEANVSLYQQDIDLELEKDARHQNKLDQVRQEVIQQLQEQIQVLLSDPDAEVSSWPVELVALRDKIHGDARLQQEKELSSLRDELSEDKWRQRRNLSFDQNRHLEEVTKERDDLKRVAVGLHRVVGQLVAYCARAEDELNRTVLANLLARLLPEHEQSFVLDVSRASSPDASQELNTSAVSRRVHFAPELEFLGVESGAEADAYAEADEASVLLFLQQQRDLSADIKLQLERSLRRLRHEATSLLDLSAKLATKRHDANMLESSQVQITDLVEDLDSKHRSCDNCELHRKNMEEAMAECLQRENLLRSELETAMIRIAHLMTTDRMNSGDVIAEGYGTGCTPSVGRTVTRGTMSLEGTVSPRDQVAALTADLDALQRDRDDLCQQLEAANRQLRSTRQFVEEQANEREHERDEFARALADLRDDNARLTARLHNNARILNEMHRLHLSQCNCRDYELTVEQLETQTREMNQIIADLESRRASSDEELKARDEKITILRDVIANLESQLEQKATHEKEIVQQLELMRQTIDERDGKMRSLLGELEALRSEKAELTQVSCVNCTQEEEKHNDLLDQVKEQCQWLEQHIHCRTQRLERLHDECEAATSEPSEDVSLRDQKGPGQTQSPGSTESPRPPRLVELLGIWECLQTHYRAEEAALKRIHDLEMQRAHLKDVAQEVRAERDVLQARMSEQALKISSLSARLQQHRNDADARAHHAASQLSVRLHDACAEVEKLKEDLESKDKQLLRLKQSLEEKDKLNEQHQSLYGNSCNPKDKVVILERELSAAQSRIAQLESLAKGLEADKDALNATLRDLQRALAEKEEQLQELLALKLDDDNQREDRSENAEGKVSARTLSDIVSISEFDEQDLQMRRAELRTHNLSLTGVPHPHTREKLQRTLPPDMSSLHIEYIDHSDLLPSCTPRADSLPAHLTSTQNKDALKQYKRNVNETTLFSVDKMDATKHNIPDNCSMYPNRDVSDSKNVSVEPKVIDFSVEPSQDNRTRDEEFTSLRELGITLDIKQENFPDILTQLKHEIKKSRSELENCKSELKNAEEQLCEFPALKEEVEELKNLLENTMATMETDKKFYENQLENFTSNKKLLEQRTSELTQEVNDKSKDLHLLKEDILRRENMILELAKEKRNLTNKLAELEVKIDELQSRNKTLENSESEKRQMREKLQELGRLEQLVSEKNHQIDSLNQHLDRLDDLQRRLDDKTEELDNLKESFEEKSNELFQLQDTVEALNRDVARLNEANKELNTNNKELKLKLSKLEKEQENASLKLQSSESEVERLNSLNGELTSKIDELKLLNDKLKDKETEIEILNEDIKAFHEEIASLKEQLKMVSRSPSPRSKGGEDKRSTETRAGADMKQLMKIRKQISLMQHELDFHKKELNDKAFELAKAKLEVTELRNNCSQAQKICTDKEAEVATMQAEIVAVTMQREQLKQQLEALNHKIREESNMSELKEKLRGKVERCRELEAELQDTKDLVERLRSAEAPVTDRALVVSGSRSPTAELERALRDQLNYSHELDDDIMEQILSASSDEREDIPRLALNSSKSSSPAHSSSSERVRRLRHDNEQLQLQLNHLQLRLADKDALIAELNRIRDKLTNEWQTSQLRYETERDNAARLQLLLAAHKDTADTLQNQDSSMIQMLKQRLESGMASELELQQQLHHARNHLAQLQRDLHHTTGDESLKTQLHHELENSERLRSEISVLKCKLEVERTRAQDADAALQHARARHQRAQQNAKHNADTWQQHLADANRLKHEAGVELLRAKELLNIQSETITELEKKLNLAAKQRSYGGDTLTEMERQRSEMAREIATLRKSLADAASNPQPDRDQAVRYLHGRCLRLESCRKALVWQKRYLQRVLAGYHALERQLAATPRQPATPHQPATPRAARFKCVALAVVVVLRMGFLVRRRHQMRAISARCILREHNSSDVGPSPAMSRDARLRDLRVPMPMPMPASPLISDFVRRSPYNISSPREEPFLLSSPRGETASLCKLQLVGRGLARDLP